jgi:hypothetical protein
MHHHGLTIITKLSYMLKPTGTHVQYMCILIRDDIDVHNDNVESPTFIRRIWRPSPEDTNPPSWTDEQLRYTIMSRETAVRYVAHLSRKPFNMLVVSRIVPFLIFPAPHKS